MIRNLLFMLFYYYYYSSGYISNNENIIVIPKNDTGLYYKNGTSFHPTYALYRLHRQQI
jgi:hypothetical protein